MSRSIALLALVVLACGDDGGALVKSEAFIWEACHDLPCRDSQFPTTCRRVATGAVCLPPCSAPCDAACLADLDCWQSCQEPCDPGTRGFPEPPPSDLTDWALVCIPDGAGGGVCSFDCGDHALGPSACPDGMACFGVDQKECGWPP